MKRFFIFAAMLAALTLNAADLQDDPPLVLPDQNTIILVPSNMFDIDRSISSCGYTYDVSAGEIHIECYGTGQQTVLFLEDNAGRMLTSQRLIRTPRRMRCFMHLLHPAHTELC